MKREKRIKQLCFGLLAGIILTACGNPAEEEGNLPQDGEVSAPEAWEDSKETEELEDFSMPVKEKVKLDGAKYENVALAAEQLGLDFQAPESFSNGYEFIWLTVNGEDSMTLTYAKDGLQAELIITGQGKQAETEMRVVEEKEVSGVLLTTGLYIHFEMPYNWEEIITEEQQELLDKGWAGGGVDDIPKEIIRHDIYELLWQDGNSAFCLNNNVLNDVPIEDMEQMAAEWIELHAEQ